MYHRLRGVPDAAVFAELAVVDGEEVFVEVDDWVVGPIGTVEVAEDLLEVAALEDLYQLIEYLEDTWIHVGACDMPEEAT